MLNRITSFQLSSQVLQLYCEGSSKRGLNKASFLVVKYAACFWTSQVHFNVNISDLYLLEDLMPQGYAVVRKHRTSREPQKSWQKWTQKRTIESSKTLQHIKSIAILEGGSEIRRTVEALVLHPTFQRKQTNNSDSILLAVKEQWTFLSLNDCTTANYFIISERNNFNIYSYYLSPFQI